jgi:hypothetical protein
MISCTCSLYRSKTISLLIWMDIYYMCIAFKDFKFTIFELMSFVDNDKS